MSAQTNAITPLKKQKRSRLLATPWPIYVVAILLSVTFLFPLFWMATTSLKTMEQAYAFPPVWFPHPVMWSRSRNFRSLLSYTVTCTHT